MQKFIEFMLSRGFMGIHTPKITSGISEGGSCVFKLNYVNGQIASLAQSPQLYKQMAINAGLKKVFEVGSIFRAEKSHTHRHLCEYVGLHVEMEIKEHYFEVIKKKSVFNCNSSSAKINSRVLCRFAMFWVSYLWSSLIIWL
jgi:aspartyl-tRNA synthetase